MTLPGDVLARRLGLPQPQTRDVVCERDLPATMDDGAVLLADRYRPRRGPAGPTLLVRSPYGRRGPFGLLYGRLFAERGFQVVIQSVRGTFGSGGEFEPFDERTDGLATIAWLRAQPWQAGPIGMLGASYLGLVQWAVAREADDSLGALAMSVSASEFHSQAYGGGGLSLETALSWVLIVGSQKGRLGPLRALYRLRRRLPALLDRLPVGELGELAAGRPLGFYDRWLAHPAAEDRYWTARDYSAGVGDVRTPVQLVGGWQDIFLPWMLADYCALRRAGRRPQLVVGPWVHTSPGLLAAGHREALAWLRAHLLDDRRLLDPAPVRLHIGGAERWRAFDDWPPPGVRPWRLHLQPRGVLDGASPPPGEADRFRYDPADPTPSLGGPVLFAGRAVVDNRPLEARPDVLAYTTAPLTRPVEAIGPVRVEIHVRSSLPHFDVFARVCDVDPAGVPRNVCDALRRVRPGEGRRAADGSVAVAFALWPTAHRFAAGHRVRLLVSSGAHPRYVRNLGTGEPAATATRMLAADQEVFHDPGHPSWVELSRLDGG